MWFSPLVAVAALLAGWRSGLLATVLGLVATAALFTIGQPGEPNSPYVFAVAGLLISIGGDWVYRSKRLAQQRLEEREAHLRSIFDTAPDAMIVIDGDGEHPLVFACRRIADGWIKSDTRARLINVEPTHWRPWAPQG